VSWLFGVAAVLVLWAGIAALRRKGEAGGQAGRRSDDRAAQRGDDDIDRDELERAEREVRDLDAMQRPDEGFEGDDWGPGAARRH
jgi:hypothetical protein